MRLGLAFFVLLSAPRVFAQTQCDPVAAPLTDLKPMISNIIEPLKPGYLDLTNFKVSPVTADLARMEQVVDPPNKRWTTTFLVRGDSFHQMPKETHTSLNILDDPNNALGWDGQGKFFYGTAETYNSIGTIYLNGKEMTLKSSGVTIQQGELTPEQAQAMSFDDKVKFFSGLQKFDKATGQITNFDLQTARMAATYLQLTSQTNSQGVANALEELKGKISTSEKLKLVQMVGSQAGDNDHYSQARSKAIDFSSIDYHDILYNLKDKNQLGVCRDIAPLQSQMLHALGFKNVYVTGYNAGGNHATVVAQNPDNPKQLLQFNYGDLQTAKLSAGTNAIVKGGVDFSTEQTFYDYTGRSVATIPAPIMALMHEGSGGDIKDIDPFLRPQGSIAQVAVHSPSGNTDYSVFVGDTSSNDHVVGAGMTNRLGNVDKNTFSVKGTSTVAYQERKSLAEYSDGVQTGQAIQISSNIDATLTTGWKNVNLGDPANGKLQVKASETTQARLNMAASQLNTGYSKEKDVGGDTSVNAVFSGDARYVSADGKTKLNGKAAVQYSVGTTNISGDAPNAIYRNLAYVDVNGQTVVLPSGLKASFDAAVGLRVFGPQVMGSVSVANPSETFKATAGYQGATNKDAFTVAPGMTREYFLELEKKFPKSVVMTVYYEQPVGSSFSDGMIQVGVKGSVTELLKKK